MCILRHCRIACEVSLLNNTAFRFSLCWYWALLLVSPLKHRSVSFSKCGCSLFPLETKCMVLPYGEHSQQVSGDTHLSDHQTAKDQKIYKIGWGLITNQFEIFGFGLKHHNFVPHCISANLGIFKKIGLVIFAKHFSACKISEIQVWSIFPRLGGN